MSEADTWISTILDFFEFLFIKSFLLDNIIIFVSLKSFLWVSKFL